jgi:tRNA (cmo5U34)-methyltransferase
LIAEAAAAATHRGLRAAARRRVRRRQLFAQLLQALPALEVTLVDLSAPMLARAEQRTTAAGAASVRLGIQGDIRDVGAWRAAFDVIVAAAVFPSPALGR